MCHQSTLALAFSMVALCVVSAQGRSSAQTARSMPVKVEVDSVLAGESHDGHPGIDQRLGPGTRCRLKTVFDYTSYRLVKHEEAGTESGQPVAFNLPGGRILHVEPLAIEGNMVAMELVLFAGAHSIMRTELKMMRGGALILVGPRSPSETYITTIAVETIGVAKELPSVGCSSDPTTRTDLPSARPPQ
jgi:hypothetical protein